ncbi:MAG: aminotransferase class V-fold PLP-dependent enzyme [Gammaproteobacteria bacterium]|nr:aminotransferase class V-fold PLP-dependent enzyme [Gammaproteobacteria bacterium]
MNGRPPILLNPGPVTLSDSVRKALLHDDMCHREADFAALMLDIKQRLARVYAEAEEEFEAVTLTGSGTCAVEAMIDSLAPRESTTLVLSNGVYGERIAAMLGAHKRPYVELRADWREPMALDRARRKLEQAIDIGHIVAVHNETTSGRLNELEPLLALCAEFECRLLLDAVSSFGAERIDFSHPNLDAVASTGNKCLHGIVGIAFVMARKRLFETGTSQADGLYTDLFRYQAAQVDGFSPFTPAVHACFALRQALDELERQGGWRGRRARYRLLSRQLRERLDALGVAAYIDDDSYSSMISSFALPRDWDYPALHDALRDAGFIIYAGQGDLYKEMFRICTMGDIRDDDLARLLATLERLLCA